MGFLTLEQVPGLEIWWGVGGLPGPPKKITLNKETLWTDGSGWLVAFLLPSHPPPQSHCPASCLFLWASQVTGLKDLMFY